MAKNKSPTPQEIYRARKQQQEEEAQALLPPGMINHGNTCFMNSVLQGLLATRVLYDLAHFYPIPPEIQQKSPTILLSQRSPQLTNGHNLSPQYDQAWVDVMPLGDVFLSVMHRAWTIQEQRKRESLSPKQVLGILGRKHDQYLDFAQQDAHEFLRLFLDAMRMEEFDVIKKRQPPPTPSKTKKRRRRHTITPFSLAHLAHEMEPDAIPEEDKLMSMVDMIFGGSLTSILVCQKCKNISQTFEDFNDLSLSIKAEDYAKGRKRDRLKHLAKKLGVFNALPTSPPLQHRSSSVPPPLSPRERPPVIWESPTSQLSLPVDEPRRKSFDGAAANTHNAPNGLQVTDSGLQTNGVAIAEPTNEDSVVDHTATDREQSGKKGSGTDAWSKIRRISLTTMGLGKSPTNGGERKGRPRVRTSQDGLHEQKSRPPTNTRTDDYTPRTSISGPAPSGDFTPEIRIMRPSIEPAHHVPPEDLPATHTQDPRPTSPPLGLLSRHSSLTRARSKSPKPPKPTAAEAEFLRRILADVVPASASSNPFNLAKTIGQLPGVEECLRMFTAVEVMDGDNSVGCRRCWKIANGLYTSRTNIPDELDDAGIDSGDEDDDATEEVNRQHVVPSSVAPEGSISPRNSSSAPSIALYSQPHGADVSSRLSTSDSIPTSASDSAIPVRTSLTSLKLSRTASLSSPSNGMTYSDDSISVSIEAGSPILETPLTARPLQRPPGLDDSHLPLADHALLSAPGSRPPSVSSIDVSSDGDSDTSAATSRNSFDSSASADPLNIVDVNGAPPIPPTKVTINPKKPKPTIMQPAYKRYLIATAPPVLVIHLKRFQQISRSMLSFSSGFKKLEDYVMYPELLDLTPFMAPKKEDFGIGKSAKKKAKNEEQYMYRLYAVVVHIGSMLGGHYIAYTALPTAKDLGAPSPHEDSAEDSKYSERQWAYISDTVVRLTTKEEVLKAKAYICMYERI